MRCVLDNDDDDINIMFCLYTWSLIWSRAVDCQQEIIPAKFVWPRAELHVQWNVCKMVKIPVRQVYKMSLGGCTQLYVIKGKVYL